MSKTQTLFDCTNCGAQFQKWAGRCLECGKWGTIGEEGHTVSKDSKKETETKHASAKTISLANIKPELTKRILTQNHELDRVLGGGIVPGSYVLLGGEPGIGKSTLTLQIAGTVENTLYISGEESVEQIKLRADRIDKTNAKGLTSLLLANETNVEIIAATIAELKPPLAIIDSIQTIHSDEIVGEAGNISQVKACAVKLLEVAKSSGTAIILIGHVTKEGAVAGPRTLEHLVDTVLYLEGDRYHDMRILRAVKNRFGSTDEIGMFQMDSTGLVEVSNPSEKLLSERGESMPGSVVTCLMEGSRPLLVEIQALVNKTVFGYPVRKASGFDLNRLHVLIAVLQKRANVNLSQCDVHVNVVGGIQADEPAADLAVALAVASAFKDKSLGNDLAVFGEVGLGGEIRSIKFLEKRMKECENLGMKRILTTVKSTLKENAKIKVIPVQNIADLIKHT
jgi:DNA repair protein RadA/Sms